MKLPGMTDDKAEQLYREGFKGLATVASANPDVLASASGIDAEAAAAWIEEAGRIISEEAEGNGQAEGSPVKELKDVQDKNL